MHDLTLGDVCEAIVDCEHKTAPTSPAGQYPSIRTTYIKNGRLDLRNAPRVDASTYREWTQRRTPRPGDIVLAREAPVGEVGLIPPGASVVLGQRTVLLAPSCDHVDSRYLLYLLLSPPVQNELLGKAGGSTVDHLNMRDIRALPLPQLPDLPAQRAIAAVLGALDDKIEANRALNETLEATCRALFRSWFVDFDPVVAKSEGRRPPHLTDEVAALFPDRFEDSPLGPVPAGWNVEPLDAIANFQNGLALQKYRPAPGELRLPVIKIAQLRDGAPGNDEWASANINEICVLDDGDVVFSWSGSLMVTIWCGGRGALNQHLFKVTSERFPKWFYHQWTLHHLLEFQGIAADKATTMGHIRRHHLTEAACVVPSPSLIGVADQLLGPVLEHYVAASAESRTLATLRDALLPRLLSGELRVRQAEQLVEEAI